LETEYEALNNNYSLFLMPGPLDEISSSKTNGETVLNHAWPGKGTFEKHCGA
jgi:hypothetical protein